MAVVSLPKDNSFTLSLPHYFILGDPKEGRKITVRGHTLHPNFLENLIDRKVMTVEIGLGHSVEDRGDIIVSMHVYADKGVTIEGKNQATVKCVWPAEWDQDFELALIMEKELTFNITFHHGAKIANYPIKGVLFEQLKNLYVDGKFLLYSANTVEPMAIGKPHPLKPIKTDSVIIISGFVNDSPDGFDVAFVDAQGDVVLAIHYYGESVSPQGKDTQFLLQTDGGKNHFYAAVPQPLQLQRKHIYELGLKFIEAAENTIFALSATEVLRFNVGDYTSITSFVVTGATDLRTVNQH